MGSPDFAVPTLRALEENGYDIRGVVTQPDRKRGRGRKPSPTPVKMEALKSGREVMQPVSVRSDDFREAIRRIAPDFLVVVAYGAILPPEILAIPSRGSLNAHASLLPKYRGPAPIQWAVINGETETGVTIMSMDKGLDTGDILLSLKTPIGPDDTSQTLHDRLADIGAEGMIRALAGMEQNHLVATPQDHLAATDAPLLKKEDGRMDWKKSARELETFIRGMTPWPGAFSFCDGKRFKIFKATPLNMDADMDMEMDMELPGPPGSIFIDLPDRLMVKTGDGALLLLEIQSESGKRLPVKTFLSGWNVGEGAIFI